ncbi:Hypothetical protein CAP_8229 [Chondromyces apiculatus DSM 436]|uniref:Uncharacterized protein n=1 Tax=Chondromyces apiculatus DSM 436 TaxID=1192034 RepID=A0A017TEK8_9BACT|nr:Hypothetical protein CAP_8229 [Chondromyces apiculatus DSM 436]
MRKQAENRAVRAGMRDAMGPGAAASAMRGDPARTGAP